MTKAAAPGDRSELLSAYIDGELPPEDEARVENLLAREPAVRAELDGMRRVVSHLRHVERTAPPPTLDLAVARRVALDGEQHSLLDRIEDGMAGLGGGRQTHIMSMFALVLALAAIIWFFSYGLHKMEHGLIPVIFGDAPEIEDADLSTARRVLAGSSLFERTDDDLWVQDGLAVDTPSVRTVSYDSDTWRQLLAAHPDLRAVAMLGHVKLRVDGEVIELVEPPAGPDPADALEPAPPSKSGVDG